MSTNPPLGERPERLEQFVRFRHEHLRGDEKGEAQVFLDRFFQALGHEGVFQAGATLEERVPRRDRGGTAFADLVWKPRVLVEMKKAGEDLHRHYRQAFEYWMYLVPDRPRHVVLCNFDEFWIYDFDRQLDEPIDRVAIEDLPRRWEVVAFLLPQEEEPVFGNDLVAVTRESAARVSFVFNLLVRRGVERPVAQRFILQALMAMFSEDIGLLPRHSFTTAVDDSLNGGSAYDLIFGLFNEMNRPGITQGGRFAETPYFNGGLFREIEPFELEPLELRQLKRACEEDWSRVKPAIFGTLFEQSLEAEERHAYGAHFTSEADIQKVVLPTIVRPWRERIDAAGTIEELHALEQELLQHRVLDPACGCGNFLYIAYRELRRLEKDISDRVRERRQRAGARAEIPLAFVSTTQFYGLDVNAFAVEVAKVTLMLARKLAADELDDERAVLPLDDLDANFTAADALTVEWPPFETCIGNPPYLGRRWIATRRGADYASWLAREYPDVGGVSDYVSYWFRLAHDRLPDGGLAGLVGTDTIREGDTRTASLDYIVDNGGVIHDAVSSQPWSGDATLRVSIVNWAKGIDVEPKTLWLADGTTKLTVEQIPPSLSPELDLGRAPNLAVNRRPKWTFQGQTPGHAAFVLDTDEARELVRRDPTSAEVVFPYLIGDELNEDGQPGRWVIDNPAEDAVAARHWPGAYERARQQVLPARERAADEERQGNERILEGDPNARVNWHDRNFLAAWWRLNYRRADLIRRIEGLPRYIALSRVAVERRQSVYAFLSPEIRPGDRLQVFAFADDYSFGILHSSWHRYWFDGRGTRHGRGAGITYTAKVFSAFPWPQSPTSDAVDDTVDVVARLLAFREEQTAAGVGLGDLYSTLNEPGRNPLRVLHEELDDAVREAYGFSEEDDPRAQLLALNASMAEEAEEGLAPRGPGPDGLENTTKTEYRIAPTLKAGDLA